VSLFHREPVVRDEQFNPRPAVSERRSMRAAKSLRSDDSFTRSSFVKSVPIHEPSMAAGGTRIVRAIFGR
jgi:hypothetical protein